MYWYVRQGPQKSTMWDRRDDHQKMTRAVQQTKIERVIRGVILGAMAGIIRHQAGALKDRVTIFFPARQ